MQFFILLVGILQSPSLDNAIVEFEVTHMSVLKVEGTFDHIRGEVKQVGDDEWLIRGSIDVRSIDTSNKSRDEMILTEQYLDADNYPAIVFEGRLVRKNELILATIDIEIRGIYLQLTFELIENEGILISSPITFKRSDIGLDFGLMDSLIGNEVAIVIHSGMSKAILDK